MNVERKIFSFEDAVATQALIRPQCQQLWCWASVAEFLHKFYETDSLPSQPEIATRVLCKDCSEGCGFSASAACDELADLAIVLGQEGLVLKIVEIEGDLDLSLVEAQAKAGHPVAFGASRALQSHFAVITDWISVHGLDYLEIMDPAGGLLRYLPAEVIRRFGYPFWGELTRLFLTRPSSGIDDSCPEGDVILANRSQLGSRHQSELFQLLDMVSKIVVRDVPDGWEDATSAVLEAFLALGGDTPRPLRGLNLEDIEVSHPIDLLTIQDELMNRLAGLEVSNSSYGLPLTHARTRRPLGLLEMMEVDGEWTLEALTFAPGRAGDRYVREILRALGDFREDRRKPAILRLPQFYENAVLSLDVERVVSSDVSLLGDDFSFLNKLKYSEDKLVQVEDYGRLIEDMALDLDTKIQK